MAGRLFSQSLLIAVVQVKYTTSLTSKYAEQANEKRLSFRGVASLLQAEGEISNKDGPRVHDELR
eukprot:5237641-Pyramimonas_sp.AAC.1